MGPESASSVCHDETVCDANAYLGVLKWLRTRDPPCPWTHDDRLHARRAIFIQDFLTLRGLPGEVDVIITDNVCEIEALE